MQELKYNLFNAYYEARRNKRNTHNQIMFEINYEEKLWELYDDLQNGNYKVGKSIAFVIDEPVKREIFAADFRDRIIHHLLFYYINPILEPQFIDDSYSCRRGKGTLMGIQRAYEHMKLASCNFTKTAYILKLDIQGYFMSINKDRLTEKLGAMIPEEFFLQSRKIQTNGNVSEDLDFNSLFTLLETVIYNNPVSGCSIKGSYSDWKALPDSKSLFKATPNCGLPIGNLTSQLFSNVYLNAFDHYVKEFLKIESYGRYVDDFYIFHQSKETLQNILVKCKRFLAREGLVLHPKKIYLQHYSKGFQFLGAYIKPHRIYIGKKTAKRFKSKVFHYKSNICQRELSLKNIQDMRASLNSYLGIMSHYNTYHLRLKTLFRYPSCTFLKYGYFSRNCSKITIYPTVLEIHLHEIVE
jgi:RNA-directed DNA polymerase